MCNVYTMKWMIYIPKVKNAHHLWKNRWKQLDELISNGQASTTPKLTSKTSLYWGCSNIFFFSINSIFRKKIFFPNRNTRCFRTVVLDDIFFWKMQCVNSLVILISLLTVALLLNVTTNHRACLKYHHRHYMRSWELCQRIKPTWESPHVRSPKLII